MTKKYDKDIFKITKLSSLIACAKYINKYAELGQEAPMSENEIVEMVARADEKLSDEVIETADNKSLKVMMVESLVRAAEDMAESKPTRVQPEDTNLKNLGEGSVLRQASTNPNARTDGVDLMPEINIIETNLMSTNTGEGETEMNETKKIAALTENMLKLANEVSKLKEEIMGLQAGLNQDDSQATSTKDVAQENSPEDISKLTKEDDIYKSKTSDNEVSELVAAPEKNEKAPEEIKGEGDGPAKTSFASDKERLMSIVAKYRKESK